MTQLDFIDHDNATPDVAPEHTHEVLAIETAPEGNAAGTNDGTVSEDPTLLPPPIKSASTDPMDDHQQTGVSGHPSAEAPAAVPLRLFSTMEELFAPTDWGDVLRLANFRYDEIRLTANEEGIWRLILYNRATGMWRMQGDTDFQPLFDVLLSEANDEALSIAVDDPTIGNGIAGRLRKHVESSSGGSVTKAIKRCARVADDPCVPIDRVDLSSVNAVDQCPVILCRQDPVRLDGGVVVDPAELKPLFLLDMTPAPTAFAKHAISSEAPGAVMMKRFLQYLGNGDETLLCRRLGWQLSGHHQAIDVIAGDCDALALLAQALRDTLGPGGARILSMGRGAVTTARIADAMEQTKLSLWMGADTARSLPVWDLHGLASDLATRCRGNLILLVTEWPSRWDTLDHRMAAKCGWAWRVEAPMAAQGINGDLLLNQDGRECLLARLVEGATDARRQFQATKDATGVGDPGQVAADDFTLACAEELRLAGAVPEHRTLYRALRVTDDERDVMTLSDIDDAVTAIGEEPIPHHVVGKMIRRMWPTVESGRDRIDGAQTRVIRRIAPRSPQQTDAYGH